MNNAWFSFHLANSRWFAFRHSGCCGIGSFFLSFPFSSSFSFYLLLVRDFTLKSTHESIDIIQNSIIIILNEIEFICAMFIYILITKLLDRFIESETSCESTFASKQTFCSNGKSYWLCCKATKQKKMLVLYASDSIYLMWYAIEVLTPNWFNYQC